MKSMHIALLHYAAPPVVGGVEQVIGQHARLLAAHGFQVRLVAGRGAMVVPRVRFVRAPLVDSRHPAVLAAKRSLDKGRVPADFSALSAQIESELREALAGVDVVIAHNVCSLHKNLALTAALRRLCAQPAAPRLILWHHDLAWTTPRYRAELYPGWPWSLLREQWPEVQAQHVVVSETRRQELVVLLGLAVEQVVVAPSGVDVAAFYKLSPETVRLRQDLGLAQADPLLLLPVRITRRKNIELALRSVAALRQQAPGATLVVTGPPGPHNPANQAYLAELRTLRAALGLRGRDGDSADIGVHFLAEHVDGYLPDAVIADFYRLADAMLLPSREEGFGIPVLEAALSGLPIFCADIPPLRALAGPDATYFASDADPASVAACILERLQTDPATRLRRRIRQDYTWERIFTQHIRPLLQPKQPETQPAHRSDG